MASRCLRRVWWGWDGWVERCAPSDLKRTHQRWSQDVVGLKHSWFGANRALEVSEVTSVVWSQQEWDLVKDTNLS